MLETDKEKESNDDRNTNRLKKTNDQIFTMVLEGNISTEWRIRRITRISETTQPTEGDKKRYNLNETPRDKRVTEYNHLKPQEKHIRNNWCCEDNKKHE